MRYSEQFDSYWYFKGTHGGITAWEPMPNIFPSGMDPSWVRRPAECRVGNSAFCLTSGASALLLQVPAPLVLHSRMFDWPSAYSMNYSFEVALTQDMSMPVDVRSDRLVWGAFLLQFCALSSIPLRQTSSITSWVLR